MENNYGLMVEKSTHYPVIVSASRSTDIPAFYAQWFVNQLKAGYVVWTNPFNRKQMYVWFKNTKVVVFWSKNPKPLLPYLNELDDRNIRYYFQFTLNDYEQEGFEPNVPPLKERIETFKALSQQIGKERVIWRFDPLIVTPNLTPDNLLEKMYNIGNQLKGCTDKLVFSFVDVKDYRKVQANLVRGTSFFTPTNAAEAELNEAQMIEAAEGLVKIREQWKSEGWAISLATCAEQLDLKQYGIEHNCCIDGELVKKIFADDADLLHYLAVNQKDKGQRKYCFCITSKDIGSYNTCPHNCVYCYANKQVSGKCRTARSGQLNRKMNVNNKYKITIDNETDISNRFDNFDLDRIWTRQVQLCAF